MSGARNILSQYVNSGLSVLDAKKATLVDVAETKKMDLRRGGYVDAAKDDAGVATAPMTADELINPGTVIENVQRATGRTDYMLDSSRRRTGLQEIGDTTVDIINGVMQGALGIGGLAAGAVDADAGAAVAGFANRLTESAETDLQSDALAGRRRAAEARNEVTAERNAIFEQNEIGEGSSDFMAGMRRIGRDFIDSVANTDDVTRTSGIASGIGSLLLGGVIGKGLKAVTAGRAGMGVSIGAQEGGGAYNQTVNEVLGMSHDQLLVGSPEYASMVQSGMDPEEARNEIANGAGLKAAAIAAPIGAVTGRIMSGWEANPLTVPSVRSGVNKILLEGVEEAIQSGGGQAATNEGIRAYADQNRDMLEGVGRSAGEGALFGIGTAGALQGPGVAARGAAVTAKFIGNKAMDGARAIGGAITRRAEAVDAAVAAESTVSREALDGAINTAQSTAANPNLREELIAGLANGEALASGAEDLGIPAEADYVDRILNRVTINAEEEANAEVSPVVADAIRGATDRFDAIRRVSVLAAEPSVDMNDRLDAGMYILRTLEQNRDLFNQDLPAAITLLDPSHPVRSVLDQFEDVLKNLESHPEIKGVLGIATQLATQLKAEDMATNPKAVETALQVAEVMPDKADLDVTTEALKHAVRITPERLASITATVEMLQAAKTHEAEREQLNKETGRVTPNVVSDQVLLDAADPKSKALSGAAHFAGIMQALRTKNVELASMRLSEFMQFAQHMSNKVDALNANYALGDGSETNASTYDSLNPRSRQFSPAKKGLWINPQRDKSIAQAKLVESEAKAIAALANRLASINSQLGIKPIAVPSLVPELQGTTAQIARAHRAKKQAENLAAKKSAPVSKITIESYVDAYIKGEGRDSAEMEQFAANNSAAIEKEFQRRKAEADATTPVDKSGENKSGQDAPAEKRNVVPEQAPVAATVEAPTRVDEPARSEPVREPTEVTTPVAKATEEKESPTTGTGNVQQEGGDTATAAEVTLKAEPKSTKEAWPDLVVSPDNSINWFHSAFKLMRDKASRLFGTNNPIGGVRVAFQSQEALEEYIGKPLGRTLTSDTIKGYNELMGVAGKSYLNLKAMLAARLAQKIASGQTIGEALVDGNTKDGANPVNTQRESRVLNLVRQENGEIVYDENLLGSALLAGLNWLLNEGQRKPRYDKEKIGKLLKIDEDEVTDDDFTFFNNQLYLTDAVETIARNIQRYWNVSPNKDVPVGYTRGIPEGMAKDILRSFEDAGLIIFPELKRAGEVVDGKMVPGKTYVGVKTTLDEKLVDKISSIPDLIERMVALEPEVIDHVGSPPKAPTTQKIAGKERSLPKHQQVAAERESNTPFTLNMPMLNMFLAMGEENMLELFGHTNLDSETLNEKDREARAGFNLTITGAYAQIKRLVAIGENMSAAQGKKLEELEYFFAYEFSRVNRMHMQGAYNPQANKLMRHLLMSTNDTLDLTDKAMFERFMLATAQLLGEKIHRMKRADAAAAAAKAISAKYPETVDLLRFWIQKNGSTQIKLSKADIAMIQTEMGAQADPAALYALMEYARFMESTPAEQATFKTAMYVEADGITDGAVNGMMHLVSGDFTPHWLEMMAKGGMFIGSSIKSLADFVTTGAEGAATDFYEFALLGMTEAMTKSRAQHDTKNAQVLGQRNSLLFAMTQLMPRDVLFDLSQDVSALNDSLKFNRGVAKNPMTTIMYGAGMKSIAKKFAAALQDEMYRRMSENDIPNELRAAFNQLINKRARIGGPLSKTPGKMYVQDAATGLLPDQDGYRKFSFSSAQFANLTTNIQTLFVTPLGEGINQAIGEALTGREPMQTAIQVQSLLMEDLFRTRVAAALAARKKSDPNWGMHQALSSNELDEILAGVVAKVGGLIETGNQTFFPAASDNADISDPTSDKKASPVELSRSSDGQVITTFRTAGPGDAGVRGSPYMVIGPGDGQMVQNAINDPNRPEGALYVFDGIHIKLSTLEADSRVINKGVYDGWLQGNPLQAVSTSFQRTIAALPDIKMSPSLVQKLANVYRVEASELMVRAYIIDTSKKLAAGALDNQARKNVLARVNMNVDHMASAESPFSVEGKIELTGSLKDISQKLNELLVEERAKLSAETVVEAPAPIAAEPEDATTVVIQPMAGLNKILARMKVPAEQRALLTAALKNADAADYTLITGTREQVNKYLAERHPDVGIVDGDTKGLILTGVKELFILDPNPETIVHELIHAATYNLMKQFYVDETKLTIEQREAIKRIQLLANQFMELSPVEQDQKTIDTYLNAVEEIQAQIDNGNEAAALNEFMAWVLANPALRELTRTKKVNNPLARILLDTYLTLKKLIFGGNAPKVADDMLSNLEFNTKVLVESAPANAMTVIGETLYHRSAGFGNSDRLTRVRVGLAQKIAHLVNSQTEAYERHLAKASVKEAVGMATKITEAFTTKGFNMNPQAASTFRMLVAAFATDTNLNPNSTARIQELYTHVMKNLTVKDFMTSNENDAQDVQNVDAHYAQEKMNALAGLGVTEIDRNDRTTLMSSFLALATVDDQFRAILAQMKLPKSILSKEKTLDAFLENEGTKKMDRLSNYMSGEGINPLNVQDALNKLTDTLIANAVEDKHVIEEQVDRIGGAIDRGNRWFVDGTQKLSGELFDKLDNVAKTTNSTGVKYAAQVGTMALGIINEQRGEKIAEGIISAMNKMKNVPHWSRELMVELTGRTASNARIYDMIKLVRSMIQKTRQQFREKLPAQIASQFSRKLEAAEYEAMTRGMAKTDLAALTQGYSMGQILDLLKTGANVKAEIKKLESRLKDADASKFEAWQRKSKDLAEFMLTGKGNLLLLRNAQAIASLFGELPLAVTKNAPVPSGEVVSTIDQLVSLYALEGLDKTSRDSLANLVENEAKGMDFVMSYLIGLYRGEQTKVSASDMAQINHYKGHTPSESESGSRLIVANDEDSVELVRMGYTRVADYAGSNAERSAKRRGYYYSPISGRARYAQGIMQNVRTIAGGVDPASGTTVGVPTGGMIDEPSQVNLIARRLKTNSSSTEALLPIFNQGGAIVAFERMLDPIQVARLKRTEDMAAIIGMWTGRQVEEVEAQRFNQSLIEELANRWKIDKQNKKDEYVNLFARSTRNDPIYRDAVNLFTPEARAMIANSFDEGEFWVRKDSINDAIGYRAASVGDLWTGTSRISPEIQKQARAIATAVFGKEAYRKLVQYESIFQTVITDARVTIVVKSMVVPMANIISNIYHLSSRGVPIANIARGFARKTAEIEAYVKRTEQTRELQGLLGAARGRNDLAAVRALKAEIRANLDQDKRMSFYPLIEAGEFASISDTGISQDEIMLAEGRLSEYMEKLTSKLPKEMQTLGRYAMVSRDTALFKGLQRAVEYGDFLAKATLYDDLVLRQKKTKEYALGRVTEEFVNYDRLPGRGRGYLESMGLMWFWHFKLRATKIAMSTVRNNPLHLVLASLVPHPSGVGTPVTDNALAVVATNKQGWSLGFGQLFNAYSLSPWVNVAT